MIPKAPCAGPVFAPLGVPPIMRDMATIKVTAGEGRTVPLPRSIATAPGAQLKLLVAPEEIEVDDANTHVQRALRDGDLVRVKNAEPAPLPPPPTKER